MTSRRLVVVVVVAAATLAACDNKCPTENPALSGGAGGVPLCTSGGVGPVQAGATVTVALRICPTCNQTADVCNVTLPSGVDRIIQLDPLVQACNPATSCPPACSFRPMDCTFVAPATPGTYQLLVNDPGTGIVQKDFQVVASGGASTCSG